MSVLSHVLSPWSKGLFDKAIIQSGPMSDNPFFHFSKAPSEYANAVLEDLEPEDDLDQLDSQQKLDILQKVSVEELVKRNALFEKFMFVRLPWLPIVDAHSSKPFLPKSPKELLSEGSFNKVKSNGQFDSKPLFVNSSLSGTCDLGRQQRRRLLLSTSVPAGKGSHGRGQR